MIIREFYMTRKDGVNLYKTYSDKGVYIIKQGTDEKYDIAIDAENTNYKKQVVVNVVANDDGSYDVYLLPKLTYDSSKKLVDTSKALAQVSISNTETGYSAKQQNKLAVYANVYKENCTLKGAWTFSDIDGSASVVEE